MPRGGSSKDTTSFLTKWMEPTQSNEVKIQNRENN